MDEARVGRVRFRAWRRGFREADLILGPFADQHAATLSEADFARFEQLLEQPDHDVYGWILGTIDTPPRFEDALMTSLRAFVRGGAAATADGG